MTDDTAGGWTVTANGANVRTGSTTLVQLRTVRDPQGIITDRYLPATGCHAVANARLAAAAPDLLLALELILKDQDRELPPTERETAEAAIAKATGEG